MNKILLIEDSAEVQLIVRSALEKICEVSFANTLAQAREALLLPSFAMIILDVNLPDGNGLEFCQQLRSNTQYADIPIMFLSSLSEVQDRLQGFAFGADDYMAKPFEPKELAARVGAKLKRRPDSGGKLRKGPFLVDLRKQKVFSDEIGGSKELSLTPIEFRLLIHFLQSEMVIFSREQLVETVWGNSTHVSSHTVDQHISSLRKKMGGAGKFLKSVMRKGYCFDLKS